MLHNYLYYLSLLAVLDSRYLCGSFTFYTMHLHLVRTGHENQYVSTLIVSQKLVLLEDAISADNSKEVLDRFNMLWEEFLRKIIRNFFCGCRENSSESL